MSLGDGLNAGDKTAHVVSVTGRIKAKRGHGKAVFSNITDQTGTIQLYASVNDLDAFEQFEWLDVGDIVGVTGSVFLTRRGETTINVDSFSLLTKSLHPLPEKYHGLQDKEARYRRRYGFDCQPRCHGCVQKAIQRDSRYSKLFVRSRFYGS